MKNKINIKYCMKKYVAICFIFVIVCVFIVFFSGGLKRVLIANMSDLRTTYYVGSCDEFYCTISCGVRENNYIYDGNSTSKVDCGVVSLEFYDNNNNNFIMADISIDGKIIEIILEKSPYENKYMADLGFRIEDDSDVVMSLKNSKDETRFFCVSKNWKIDFNRALVIGYEKFFDTIKGLYYNKKLHCEGYLIPISNIDYKTVFWYFSIIDTFGNIYNILIDVNSGDIII